MHKSRIAFGVLAVLVGLMLISCGPDDPKIDKSHYQDWLKISAEHFNIYISPQSSWLERKDELAVGYDRFLTGICDILEMPIPEDKIDLYVYTLGPKVKEITERDLPFSTDSEIHWGGLYPYGYQLAKFLLNKKGIKPGQFDVLNEGVPHVLDFSGFNYHDKTIRYYNSGMLTGVLDLGDNDKFDSLDFAIRRAEAASLSGFIMFNYGLPRMLMLWKSSVDWKKSIETIFQLPVDEFEQNWLAFARSQCSDPDGTVEDDPAVDVRIYQK